MNNKNIIEELLQTIKDGVHYGIVPKKDGVTRKELKPLTAYQVVEGGLRLYSDYEIFNIEDLNIKFNLLNLVFNYKDYEVYAGEGINYKGHEMVVILYKDGHIYLLDASKNYLYAIEEEKFIKLLDEEKVSVTGEFLHVDEEKVEESEVKNEQEEKATEEVLFEEEEIDLEDITLGKLGDKLIYICHDSDRNKIDLITIAFIGHKVTNQKYTRKQIDFSKYKKLVEIGELKILSENEFLREVRKVRGF